MLLTVSSFCFGHFISKVIFIQMYCVWVSVSYFHRSASQEATKRFPAVDLFIGMVSSGYKKILNRRFLHGEKKVWEHWPAL